MQHKDLLKSGKLQSSFYKSNSSQLSSVQEHLILSFAPLPSVEIGLWLGSMYLKNRGYTDTNHTGSQPPWIPIVTNWGGKTYPKGTLTVESNIPLAGNQV